MRIISGKYKGKNLLGYTMQGTRPTQDRVKESLFAMIQEKIPDAIVLDLFAGTGNLGIEALSNGAKYAYFVDNSREAYQTIQKNIENCGITNASIYHTDYRKALEMFQKQNLQFDIIFLDPPYKDLILEKVIHELEIKNLLKPAAIIICEYEFSQTQENYATLEVIKEKKYGYKNIKIYQKKV